MSGGGGGARRAAPRPQPRQTRSHRRSRAGREGVNLTFLPFFAMAVVEALGVHPNVNASYNEDTKEITYHASV
ncbi:2-oxo acid dehydrogenase subunit E2, partial [Nocardia farcinica]|uniref:2-oxo acid dehydrogenase subunit E2 n=1 Tax=Nocardia farcinica TaxID=37329 RepID=UPI003CC7FD9F